MRKEKNSKKRYLKYIWVFLFTLLFIAGAFSIYIFVILQPSNNRSWDIGFEKMPHVTIQNDILTVANLRDYQYAPNKIVSRGYTTRTVNVNDIENVWFIFEPFTVKPFTKFDGVAHTYFVFDFKNSEPIAISVEARREKNEKYDTFKGLFNKYELIYVWGSERDLTGQRGLVNNNELYMYPLQISKEAGKKLFLRMAETSMSLEKNPRFYNSLISNCTNELAKVANKVKAHTIPFDIALIFPGYSDRLLYKLKLIPTNKSFEETKKKYYISKIVKNIYNTKDFSKILREEILKMN